MAETHRRSILEACRIATIRMFLALALFTALVPYQSDAEQLEKFVMTWSGAEFGNSASATATITLDMHRVTNPGTSEDADFIRAFSITVQNAAAGNGTWSKTDYAFFRLTTGSQQLDFTRELVGQNGWGIESGDDRDFKMTTGSNGAPESFSSFRIGALGANGDRMRLTSFRPGTTSLANLQLTEHFRDDRGGGVDGRVYALGEDLHGRIVVGGFFHGAENRLSPGIVRFLPDGQVDHDFDVGNGIEGGMFGYVTGVVVLPNETVIAVGDFTEYDGTPRGGIVRILPHGEIDQNFASGAGANGIIRCIEQLPDGRFLIGGGFTEYDGTPRSRLAILTADGELDTTFDTSAGFSHPSDYVDEIEILADARFLAAGRFYEYNDFVSKNVVKIHFDGEVDPGFATPDNPGQYVEAMTVQSDGKIVLGSSEAGQIIYRLESNGERDLDFSPNLNGDGVYGILELDGGRMMVSGNFEVPESDEHSNLVILNADGSVDEDGFLSEIFPNGWVSPLMESASGNIHVGGEFDRINQRGYGHIAKFAPASPDVSFAYSIGTITEGEGKDFLINVSSSLQEPVDFSIIVESDDPSIIPRVSGGGRFTAFPGENRARIYVYFEDDQAISGSRSFRLRITPESEGATVGSPEVTTVTVEDDDVPGTVFIGSTSGIINEGRGDAEVKVRRFIDDPGALSVRLRTVDGSAIGGRDFVSLDTEVHFPEGVYEKTVSIEGPVITPEANPLRQFHAELYQPSKDAILGTPVSAVIDVNDRDDPGSAITDYLIPSSTTFLRCLDLALAPDGSLYALATFHIGNFGATGSRILKFDGDGRGEVVVEIIENGRAVNSIEFGLDGKLYAAGSGFIHRYFPDGTMDSTWANPIARAGSFPNAIRRILPLPDGKILICGKITDPIGGITRQQVARLMPNGEIDPSFDLGAVLPIGSGQWIHDMAVDLSGNILLAGNISSIQGIARRSVVRVHSDGSLDETFDASVAVLNYSLSDGVAKIDVSPEGKIYLGGNQVTRVTSDGGFDPTFTSVQASDFRIQPDGKLVVLSTGNSRNARRFDSSGQLDESFNVYTPGGLGGLHAIEIGSDGRVHIGGQFSSFDGAPAPGVATLKGGSGAAGGNLVCEAESISIGEGAGVRAIKFRRLDSFDGNVGVHYTLVSESADAGTDVEVLTGYHEFFAGETEHQISFNLLDDAVPEETESFRIVLHDASGGARLATPRTLNVNILDDDGSDLASWITRYNPSNPLDPTLLDGDPDGDGMKTFVEWMTDSDPTKSGDAKQPVSGFHQIDNDANTEERFSITFYLNPSKTGFKTIVEQSESLEADSWSSLWDSSTDPTMQSDLISGEPLEAPGWMSIRSDDPLLNKGFLRLRYEAR